MLFCGDPYGRLEERDLTDRGRDAASSMPRTATAGPCGSAADGTELVSFGNNEPVVSRWRLDRSGPITRVVAPGWTPTEFNETGELLLDGAG